MSCLSFNDSINITSLPQLLECKDSKKWQKSTIYLCKNCKRQFIGNYNMPSLTPPGLFIVYFLKKKYIVFKKYFIIFAREYFKKIKRWHTDKNII